jgi:hypothetical protein
MASSEQKPPGFTVTDRRSFSSSGEPATGSPPAEPPPAPEAPAQDSASASAARGPLPPVDFGTFVLSLGSSAIMHLGELEHPQSGKVAKDLAMAKHTIDILSMLEEKTKGNRTPQEDKLMESLLYDLRLRFVDASKK